MPDPRAIDLNADIGEGFDDDAVVPFVSSVNIACGAHAGDDDSMRTAVRLALRHGCAIGAHPGYDDREHQGRTPMAMSLGEVTTLVADQIHRLAVIARASGAALRHVKPHGALYNQAAADPALARAIASAVSATAPELTLVGLGGSALIDAARAAGLDAAGEGFCDRAYGPGGALIPRGAPGALIEDPFAAGRQALALVRSGAVRTICLHADTPGAGAIASAVRDALMKAGIRIIPMSSAN